MVYKSAGEIISAFKANDIERVNLLLYKFDTTHGINANNGYLLWASTDYMELLKLIVSHPHIDINAHKGYAFTMPQLVANFDPVKYLLDDPRSDPSICDNIGLFDAITVYGDTEANFVKLYLKSIFIKKTLIKNINVGGHIAMETNYQYLDNDLF